jgi:hypothetical protein
VIFLRFFLYLRNGRRYREAVASALTTVSEKREDDSDNKSISRGVLRFGSWCQSAFFGVFGRKNILGVSKILRIPWRIF